jgi:hypothetical protein
MLVSAGSVAATTQSTSNAPLSSSSTCAWRCFDLLANDVVVSDYVDIVSDYVDIFTAAAWCGVSVSVLATLSIGQILYCPIFPRTVKRVA